MTTETTDVLPGRRDAEYPLCIDLDGTLLRTDLLFESILLLLKRSPMYILRLPFWLLKGKARFKEQIAKRVDIAPESLPYHSEFLHYLQAERARGRKLILATASNCKFANAVALHLEIFSQVLASDQGINLGGRNKRERLVHEFGQGGFDYAGNGSGDLEVWRSCRRAILVNAGESLERAARRGAQVDRVFHDKQVTVRCFLKAIRVHQWLKNLLVFVPVFTAHQWTDLRVLGLAAGCFVAFGLVASSTYVLNDLLDLAADRSHPTKRNRPFARGDLSIATGVTLVGILLVAGLGLSAMLSTQLLACLLGYIGVTLAYSFVLKRRIFVDVLALSMLYTVRIIAGAVVSEIVLSFWLLAFATFIFLSLALVKRCSDLHVMERLDRKSSAGRGYRVADLGVLYQMGIASGYIAVLIVALYINSPEVAYHYSHPEALWLLCPLLLFWISRVWIVTNRGRMHEDPITYAMRDRVSLGVVAAIVGVVTLAIL